MYFNINPIGIIIRILSVYIQVYTYNQYSPNILTNGFIPQVNLNASGSLGPCSIYETHIVLIIKS